MEFLLSQETSDDENGTGGESPDDNQFPLRHRTHGLRGGNKRKAEGDDVSSSLTTHIFSRPMSLLGELKSVLRVRKEQSSSNQTVNFLNSLQVCCLNLRAVSLLLPSFWGARPMLLLQLSA